MAGRLSKGLWWGAGGFLSCAALATLGVAIQAQPQTPPSGVVPERVSLAGIPVGGRTQDEAKQIAEDYSARLLRLRLKIAYGKRVEETTAKKLGAVLLVKQALDALAAPRPKPENLLEQIHDHFTEPPVIDVPLTLKVGEKGVQAGLMRFALRLGAEPRNARLVKESGHFKRIAPRPGKELDSDTLADAIQTALDAPELRARVAEGISLRGDRDTWVQDQDPIELAATTRSSKPHVALADLAGITATLATFSTHLAGTRNRIHNIMLACRAIDGTVLLPGDTFSYNDTVGPRIPSAGFKEAPQIVKGQLEPGIGGGVCQVSSTLYNAALLSDMQIVRRSHHAFPVHYLPAGRDATVAYGSVDFQFKNRLEHPVAIDAKVTGGRVVFSLYGNPDDKREVRVFTARSGRSPRGGTSATVTRVVKLLDKTRREVVSNDYYAPAPPKNGSRTSDRKKSRNPGEKGDKERLAGGASDSPTHRHRTRTERKPETPATPDAAPAPAAPPAADPAASGTGML